MSFPFSTLLFFLQLLRNRENAGRAFVFRWFSGYLISYQVNLLTGSFMTRHNIKKQYLERIFDENVVEEMAKMHHFLR